MRFHHTMIRTSDLAASLDFYCGSLGLLKVHQLDLIEQRMTVAALAAPGDMGRPVARRRTTVELIYDWEPSPQQRDPFHLCFQVDDVEAEWRRLTALGVSSCREPHNGVAFVRTPDGTPIELAQPDAIRSADAPRIAAPDLMGDAAGTRFNHTMVRTADFARAIEFYQGHLGLVEVRRLELSDYRKTVVYLASSEDAEAAGTETPASIELSRDWDAIPLRPTQSAFHICYWVEDIYATCARLHSDRALLHRPPRDGLVGFARSPEGVPIEIVQRGSRLQPKELRASMPDVGAW